VAVEGPGVAVSTLALGAREGGSMIGDVVAAVVGPADSDVAGRSVGVA
jgi:hypothetical protein